MFSERRAPRSRRKSGEPQRGAFRAFLVDLLTPTRRWWGKTEREPVGRWASGSAVAAEGSRISGVVWLLGVVVIAVGAYAVLPYLSEPVLRLKSGPPAGFVSIQARGQIDEVAWAEGYWRCAREIQGRYVYAAPLPDEPSVLFHIPQERMLPPDKAEQFRRLYWSRMQKAWLNPDNWETTRPNAFRWLSNR